ncbi:phenylacetaldehyde oxime monooxygenase CYP71AN24-like [Carya illinoinensis]|uniref:phenylacetaldehyde oxime monooxygenase CYP71AN24-like n=1 Tax=Carya illinoinensis TaxID=32201 RepID=UPI001C728A92|nr:phenylacetaldehyde oxime monooxygenase CYP71AN24-like [Carya illinoinensis]
MVLLTSFSARDFFPSLGWIDVLTGLIPSLKAIVREIDPLLDQVIEEHRKVRVDDHGQPNKKDFVDTLVQLQEEETRVYVNVWAIQRDPTVWERPEEFLPERFIDNAIDFKGQDFEFLPFGGGRRGSPWLTFGLTSVEYVIAKMLCWFDWRLPIASIKGQDLGMGEVYRLTVARKIPLHLVPAILHSP